MTAVLLTLLIAALAAVAGYAVLHLWNRAAVPTTEEWQLLSPPESTRPPPVELRLGEARVAADASAKPAAARIRAPVRLQLTAEGGGGVGVGIVDGHSGALLAWQSIEDGERAAELRVPPGEHFAVVAERRDRASVSYLHRVPVTVGEGAEPATATLDPRRHRLSVALEWPALPPATVPLLVAELRRSDDPGWSPGRRGGAAVPLAAGATGAQATLELGAGRYQLLLDGVAVDDGGVLEFSVPEDAAVTARCTPR